MPDRSVVAALRPTKLSTRQRLEAALAEVEDAAAEVDLLLGEGADGSLEADLFVVQLLLSETRRKLGDLRRHRRGFA